MTLGKLYNVLIDEKYALFFAVYEKDFIFVRYKINKINNIFDFNKYVESSFLRQYESGVNSDEINILEAIFLDCYFK